MLAIGGLSVAPLLRQRQLAVGTTALGFAIPGVRFFQLQSLHLLGFP